ncbi:hypothetical protein NBE98_18055 [Clostridium swellfunianum]|uniref:hypothetical protein n=1 Tax=Clostridium swellfunianum TaxID=1367462 RepID=UPI002030E22C|nr:hypothetical protein [Clostridium swellfunianum]MCM0650273.1 hypothetical protein [Clostridium swellfunianum]
MKIIYRLLFILHAFVGVGAVGGGMMAILNPQGPGGMPADALKNSPFNNYLIPGIILFSVIGLGNIASALIIKYKAKFHAYVSSVFGWALVIWIIVQCIMLNTVVYLHVIFFIIGLIEAALAMIILFKQRMFPANLVIYVYKKIRRTM